MSHKSLPIALLMVVVLATIACAREEDQTIHVNDVDGFMGQSDVTELTMPNCESDKELSTTQVIEKVFEHEVKIRANDPDLNEGTLVGELRKYYDEGQPGGTASTSVVINVPPGSVFVYPIEWTEIWRKGNIVVGSDNRPDADYEYLKDFQGGVLPPRISSCPTTQ